MAKNQNQPVRVRPTNDVYMVLAAVALACVAGALAYAIFRCMELLGKPFPAF